MTKLLIFQGCISESEFPEVAGRYQRLLRRAGFDVATFEHSLCCGYPYRDLGRGDLFIENGKKLAALIQACRADTILSLCPTCNRHFDKHLKRDCGLSPELDVMHISSFVSRHRERIGISKRAAGLVAGYHDPCWLARRTGDTTSARQLIRACGYELRDGEASGRFGACCGHAGVVWRHDDSLSAEVARRRALYFRQLGVSRVVTNCPRCHLGLRKGRQLSSAEFQLRDLSELLLGED